jgi:hypothetical protein
MRYLPRTTKHATGVMKLTVVSREVFTDYDRERDEVIYTNMVLINIVDHTTDRFDRGSILLPEDDVANFEYERVRHGNLSAMKRDWSTLEVEPIEIPPDDFD